MRSPWVPLRVAAGALTAFTVAFVAWGLVGWGPEAANEQAIGEVSRWCERVSGGLLREPINTLGNLGFVIAGLAMLMVLARDELEGRPRVNGFIGNQPLALLYAGATVFLGPGSMAMHGSHTFFGAWLDNVSMVVYILVPVVVNLAALGRWPWRTTWRVYAAVVAGYAFGYWFFGPDLGIGIDLFGVSIAVWIISEVLLRVREPWMRWLSGFVGFAVAMVFGIFPVELVRDLPETWWIALFWLPAAVARGGPPALRRRTVPWFWLGLGSFGLAYAIWLTGTADDPRCNPDALVQPHALWHLLSAAATWCFFMYLRTERTEVAASPVGSIAGSTTEEGP